MSERRTSWIKKVAQMKNMGSLKCLISLMFREDPEETALNLPETRKTRVK